MLPAVLLDGLAEALFREVGDALYLIDPESGRILDVNPTAQSLSGFTHDQLLEITVSDLLVAESQDPQSRLQDACRFSKSFHARDGYLLRSSQNGVWIPVNVTVSRLHVKSGVLGLITVRDQREQRESYNRLKKIEGEMRRILMSVSDCLWSARIGSSGRWTYRYFSPVVERITGRPPKFFMETNNDFPARWGEIVVEEDRPIWELQIAQLRAGRSEQAEYRIVHVDGQIVWLRESVRVSQGEDKKGKLLDGVITDVTERKRSEQAVHLAKEAAEAASRIKGEFLARMSHEIRTPLNGILGMAELAAGTELSTTQRRYMEMLQSSARSLMTILEDVLDISKIEAGKLELEVVPYSLRETISDALSLQAIRAHQKKLEFSSFVAADVPDYLVGDPTRLRQIFTNLVNNAIKFTEHGEVLLEAHLLDPERSQLHFRVKDSGIGIPSEKHKIVFEAFAQGDPSTTRKYGGAGLGLGIASQLVQAMGGQIWLESEVRKGSTFHFTLPLRVSPRPPSSPLFPATMRDRVRGRRVLIVDDHSGFRKHAVELLSGWGMLPAAAESVEQAGALFQQVASQGQPFELLLIDSTLPGVHDLAQLQTFWQRAWVDLALEAPAVVLLLPTTTLGRDAETCRLLGVDAYLTKPIRESALLHIFSQLLAEGPASREPEKRPAVLATTTPLRILVAEDNSVNEVFAVHLLANLGHHVTAVHDGREVLDAVAERDFDLVLMDIDMPEMDGFAATRSIREREAGGPRQLPIIALTAHALKGFREECLAAGMDDYLAKPIQRDNLLAIIDRYSQPKGGAALKPQAEAHCNGEAEPPLWESNKALQRLDGQHEILQRLVSDYLNESGALRLELRQAIAARQSRRALAAARTLHDSLRYLEANPAAVNLMRLKKTIGGEDFAETDKALKSAEQELDRLEPALRQYCSQ